METPNVIFLLNCYQKVTAIKNGLWKCYESTIMCINDFLLAVSCGLNPFQAHLDEFLTIKRLLAEYMQNAGHILLQLAGSNRLWLRVPRIHRIVRNARERAAQLFAFFQRQLDEHQREWDPESEQPPADLIEAYLRKEHREGIPVE